MGASEAGSGWRNLCPQCRHYYITYQPATPHGCRAMGFRSAQPPCLAVYENSRLPCQYFAARQKAGNEGGQAASPSRMTRAH